MDHLWRPEIPWWHLIVRAVVVYVAILALLRVGGKRQIGQMGIFEFVALLLISNAVQNSMNGGDNSILGGVLLAGMLILLSFLFTYFTYRFRKFERFVQGRPTLLIHHGIIIHDNLRHELLSVHELKHLLRRQGVHRLDEVEEAVLESDGYISITKKTDLQEETGMRRENGC